MPKRKAAPEGTVEPELRHSTRRKSPAPQSATKHMAEDEEPIHVKRRKPASETKRNDADQVRGGKKQKKITPDAKGKPEPKAKTTKETSNVGNADDANGTSSTGKTYWLLKAEPESRIENGVDVKFSIDDLASKTEPEPWDGIRNYVARNNLRAMKKGDLAFFYQSNCKEPGIVGTMEIVQEHSPDLSAHDPKAAYYDASSKPSDPKWSVVHVEFRSKFTQPIGLKELREMGKPGLPLENIQLLKQSRLSVSRVGEAEWEYLMSVAEERGGFSKKA